MTKRAAIYLRVSTNAQADADKASLPIQLRDDTAYCEREGWSIVATLEDHESGKNVTRKGYQAVLQLARDGLIDVIVVWAPERFGRKAWEVLARVEEMKELGVEVHAVTRPMGDWLSMAINAVIGENELRVMISRMVPARRYKAAQGFWVTRVPFGTANTKGVLGRGPDFDLLQMAFQWCIDGVSLRDIARRVTAMRSGRGISPSQIRNVLRNVAYVGIVQWKGDTFPAQWEPLIDPDTFAAAGRELERRYQQRASVNGAAPYWIAGLAWCGTCGHRMVTQIQVRKGATYRYLICSRFDPVTFRRACTKHVQLLPVQDWLVDLLRALNIEEVVARIGEASAAATTRANVARKALQAEKARLEERIERAEQGYLDGLWGPERVLQIRASLTDQIESVQRELAGLPGPAEAPNLAKMRALFADRSWLDWRDTGPAEFREILRALIDKVVVHAPGQYSLTLKAGVLV